MTTNWSVEFLIWLLIAASIIAVIAKRLGIPYTAALVMGGVLLSFLNLSEISPLQPGNRPHWLTPELILVIFLPALVFEASLKLNLRELLHDSLPLLLLAICGVLIAAGVTGYLVHWGAGLPVLTALLFGAIISATDPISVLALFRSLRMSPRLSLLIEAESVLNDGTAAALFQIVLGGLVAGHLGVVKGAGQFLWSTITAAALGVFLGYLASQITATIDDPEIEITLTTIVAYGSYLLAYHLQISGIIATATAGLVVGNVGAKHSMSERTRTALQSFWEYLAFLMNSLIFLLIGLEVHIRALTHSWRPVLWTVLAVLIGRAVSVYLLVPASNLVAETIPLRWQHAMVWGGLRGGLALALALSLNGNVPERGQVLDLTFGVVIFSILVQGLTMKPLLRALKLAEEKPQPELVSTP